MLTVAQFLLAIAALTIVVMAALQDVRERLIANRLVVLLLGLGVLRHMAVATGFTDWLAIAGSAFAMSAVVFLVGFVIWRFGSLGGGDVKLSVAAAFFIGPDGALLLFAGTALAGGILALAYLLVPKVLPLVAARIAGPACLGSNEHATSLPYGVAIAAGFTGAVVPSLPMLIG